MLTRHLTAVAELDVLLHLCPLLFIHLLPLTLASLRGVHGAVGRANRLADWTTVGDGLIWTTGSIMNGSCAGTPTWPAATYRPRRPIYWRLPHHTLTLPDAPYCRLPTRTLPPHYKPLSIIVKPAGFKTPTRCVKGRGTCRPFSNLLPACHHLPPHLPTCTCLPPACYHRLLRLPPCTHTHTVTCLPPTWRTCATHTLPAYHPLPAYTYACHCHIPGTHFLPDVLFRVMLFD